MFRLASIQCRFPLAFQKKFGKVELASRISGEASSIEKGATKMAKKVNLKKAGAKKGPFRKPVHGFAAGANRQLKTLAGVKNLGRGEG